VNTIGAARLIKTFVENVELSRKRLAYQTKTDSLLTGQNLTAEDRFMVKNQL
jgi:hypothetical protein